MIILPRAVHARPARARARREPAPSERYVINCVRLHFIDLDAPRGLIAAGTDSRSFDPQQLDRLDFLVAELKKRDIYIDMNLNVGRSYRAGEE